MYEALGRLHKPESNLHKSVELQAESTEDLLHDWLADLLYEIEVNHVLYDDFEIHELTPHRLKATLRGGPIDFTRSQDQRRNQGCHLPSTARRITARMARGVRLVIFDV
jgi:SHS2 domain-containing protein